MLDPFSPGPVSLENWFYDYRVLSPNGRLLLFATKAQRFGPESRDPLFKSTVDPENYNSFFHDLFESVRLEGQTLKRQLKSLSQ